MGIKGLWSEVRPVCRQSHLSNFRGQRVAVDMYVWLHRGILGSVQLDTDADVAAFMEFAGVSSGDADAPTAAAEGTSVRLTDKFIHFVMGRVELMLRCGVHPVLVFDGAPVPAKRGTEEARRALRAGRLAAAARALRAAGGGADLNARQAAAALAERAVDITTEVAHAVIEVLRGRRLECVVAPYEADAQLAFMCRAGHVQAVVSEDSDLIAYNCPCVIAKLDAHGNCEVLAAHDLPRCPSFQGLSYESFLVGCILSGCDYLPSLRHIGVKKAFRLVSQATSVPCIMQNLQLKFGFTKEELDEYEAKLQTAYYCFAHHFVFDPIRKEVVNLTPLPQGIPLKTDVLGKALSKDIAEKVCAECMYDPVTKTLYKGSYSYCVQEYWRHVRNGQTSLNTYNGFQKAQPPRVTILLSKGGKDIPNNAAGRRVSPTTTFFSSPLQKICEATGFCEHTSHAKTTVVRSKYFTKGPWRVENWDADEDESNSPASTTSTPTTDTIVIGPLSTSTRATLETTSTNITAAAVETTTTTTRVAAAGSSGEETEASPRCMSSLPCATKDTMESSSQLTASLSCMSATKVIGETDEEEMHETQHVVAGLVTDRTCSPSPPVLPPFMTTPPQAVSLLDVSVNTTTTTTTISNNNDNDNSSNNDSPQERRGCPFGYPQCGRWHSIFELCFKGKDWVKRDPASTEGESSSGTTTMMMMNKNMKNHIILDSKCSDEIVHSSHDGGFGGKRAREETTTTTSSLSFRRAFKPPASTSGKTHAAPSSSLLSVEENILPAAKKRTMYSAEQASESRRRHAAKSETVSSEAQGNTGGSAVADELFAKMSFARR